MKLAILAAAVVAASSNQWTLVGNASDYPNQYVDLVNVQTTLGTASLWHMQDFPGPMGAGKMAFQSTKYQIQYNCAAPKQQRARFYATYAGRKGTGKLVDGGAKQDGWAEAPRGQERFWYTACSDASGGARKLSSVIDVCGPIEDAVSIAMRERQRGTPMAQAMKITNQKIMNAYNSEWAVGIGSDYVKMIYSAPDAALSSVARSATGRC